jgi:hypothetical protein
MTECYVNEKQILFNNKLKISQWKWKQCFLNARLLKRLETLFWSGRFVGNISINFRAICLRYFTFEMCKNSSAVWNKTTFAQQCFIKQCSIKHPVLQCACAKRYLALGFRLWLDKSSVFTMSWQDNAEGSARDLIWGNNTSVTISCPWKKQLNLPLDHDIPYICVRSLYIFNNNENTGYKCSKYFK